MSDLDFSYTKEKKSAFNFLYCGGGGLDLIWDFGGAKFASPQKNSVLFSNTAAANELVSRTWLVIKMKIHCNIVADIVVHFISSNAVCLVISVN